MKAAKNWGMPMKKFCLFILLVCGTSALANPSLQTTTMDPGVTVKELSFGQGQRACRANCLLTHDHGGLKLSYLDHVIVVGYGDTEIESFKTAMAGCTDLKIEVKPGPAVNLRRVLAKTFSIEKTQPGEKFVTSVLANPWNCQIPNPRQ